MNFSAKNILLYTAAFMALATLPNEPAFALSTDRDQPAEIEADDIEFDFQKGIRTYINNVLVVQGSLRLKADKVVANYVGSDLDNATAWGSLARFKQRPDGKEHDVEGWAKKIIVNQKANTLTLIGEASLKQGPQTARGDTIIYNMANDTLSLKGGAKFGAAGKDGEKIPKRTIADPFAEDGQAAGPSAPKTNKNEKKSEQAKVSKDLDQDAVTLDEDAETTEKKAAQTSQPEPVKSGRSRLIIQPK